MLALSSSSCGDFMLKICRKDLDRLTAAHAYQCFFACRTLPQALPALALLGGRRHTLASHGGTSLLGANLKSSGPLARPVPGVERQESLMIAHLTGSAFQSG